MYDEVSIEEDMALRIARRIDGLSEWLNENAPMCDKEQAHLDEGARERAYWHYGYLMALRDVRNRFETPDNLSHLN